MLLANSTTLDGGLKLAIVSRREASPQDRPLLDEALFKSLQHEARTHGVDLKGRDFKHFLERHNDGDVEFLFTVAAWDVCADVRSLKPNVVGVAVEFPTVVVKRQGSRVEPYAAIFREDTCFRPEAMRQLIKQKPENMRFPDTGIAAHFEEERMRRLKEDGNKWGIVAECHANNHKMHGVLRKIGAQIGTGQNGTVLQLDCFKPSTQWPIPVEIEYPVEPYSDAALPYSFLARWRGYGGEEVVASFTNALSTFNCRAFVARVQIASNGKLPGDDVLSDVLLSLLSSGQEEMNNQSWGKRHFIPTSPIISHGSEREVLTGLMSSSQDEMLQKRYTGPVPILGGPVPTMLVHLGLDESPALQAALESSRYIHGRKIGTHSMKAVEHNVKHGPVRPLGTLCATDMDRPYHNLGIAA